MLSRNRPPSRCCRSNQASATTSSRCRSGRRRTCCQTQPAIRYIAKGHRWSGSSSMPKTTRRLSRDTLVWPLSKPPARLPLVNTPRRSAKLPAIVRLVSSSASASASSTACKEAIVGGASRSEEHTSELQSRLHLVCRLLLEKKKKKKKNTTHH